MSRDGLDGGGRNVLSKPFCFQLPNTILEVKSLYLTDAVCVVSVDEIGGVPDGVEMIRAREADSAVDREAPARAFLGDLMRVVYDLLGQFGVTLPCFCMVRPRDSSWFAEILKRLQVDQDWARGDFALAVWPDSTGGGIPHLLADLRYKDFNVSLGPLARETILRRFDERVKSKPREAEHDELLEAIRSCLSGEDTPQNAINRWVEQRKEEILYGKSE